MILGFEVAASSPTRGVKVSVVGLRERFRLWIGDRVSSGLLQFNFFTPSLSWRGSHPLPRPQEWSKRARRFCQASLQ